nr:hypothetical protein [Chitinophagaceae bacterium]
VADTGKKARTDSAQIKVIDEAGNTIRTYKAKLDTGLNRIEWNYQTKGIRQPQQPKPRPGAAEQGGGFAAGPGTYKMVVTAGKWADSGMLVVKPDPRIPFKPEVYKAQKAAMERLYAKTSTLTEANDLLTDMEEGIKKVEGLFKDEKGKEAEEFRKLGKAIQDSIKTIRENLFGKRQEKQGYGNAYQLTVQSKLNEVRQLVMGKPAIPGEQEENAYQIAAGLVDEAVGRITKLKTAQWAAYKAMVEKMPVKLLKD